MCGLIHKEMPDGKPGITANVFEYVMEAGFAQYLVGEFVDTELEVPTIKRWRWHHPLQQHVGGSLPGVTLPVHEVTVETCRFLQVVAETFASH